MTTAQNTQAPSASSIGNTTAEQTLRAMEALSPEEKDQKLADQNGQIRYAQTLIKNLQEKLNGLNGIIVQLEAKLQLAEEDKASVLEQLAQYNIKSKKV